MTSTAYVLKGYPRVSELFIASEIWRLERLGVALSIYVIKDADEPATHQVVREIKSPVEYLTQFDSMSEHGLARWLWANTRKAAPAARRIARRNPRRLAATTAIAARELVRGRRGRQLRTVVIKELFQAIVLADRLSRRAGGPPTLLHGHFAHGATTVTWFTSLLTGIPYSFTGHAKDIYEVDLNPSGLLARKMRGARFVATCTAANRSHLTDIEPSARVELVYHGLNADFARLLRTESCPSSSPAASQHRAGRARIVSVGRLVPKKGFDVLIEAVALITRRGHDVELVIAGEGGSEQSMLRDRTEALGLSERVVVVGPQTQPELLDLYRTSTVFALACRVVESGDRDGIPNVMVEAMAAGLPVVTTNVSGIPELIVDGCTGMLVPPDSPHELAAALERVLCEPALARRLGENGRRTVAEHFDGDRSALRLVELFDEAASAGSTSLVNRSR